MGSLLIPLVGSVAAKAGDALTGELMRAWGLDKARRKLERHLAAVQCILLDAEAKSRTNPAVSRWMTDLKTAAFQADDVLDDFRSDPWTLHLTQDNKECCLSPSPFFPKLETMEVTNMTKLESWHQEVAGQGAVISFPQLKKLNISKCSRLASMPKMPSLENLSLYGLRNLTSICVGNDDNDIGESCIFPPLFFPKLETMVVSKMPKLERWHQDVAGQVADISFPLLKKLDISECPMLAGMPNMLPLLEHLQVKDARDIPPHHLMNLSGQSNFECNGSIEVEPALGWRSIGDLHFSGLGDSSVRLRLKGLMVNVEQFEEELNRVPCRYIKSMDIIDCYCLFSSEPSQIQRNIWNSFRFVQSMLIADSNTIVQWPAVELGNLVCLRRLNLSACCNLTGSLPSTISDDENVLPPRLQHLEILLCGNLMEVPKLPASLEKLSIHHCRKLIYMPTFLGNGKKLRELSLIVCDALTSFPNEMYGLIALKRLEMKQCPKVETLPAGLLQQLPSLEELRIRDCPYLEKAFSIAGAHWNLVKAIPHILVGAQDELAIPGI